MCKNQKESVTIVINNTHCIKFDFDMHVRFVWNLKKKLKLFFILALFSFLNINVNA